MCKPQNGLVDIKQKMNSVVASRQQNLKLEVSKNSG